MEEPVLNVLIHVGTVPMLVKTNVLNVKFHTLYTNLTVLNHVQSTTSLKTEYANNVMLLVALASTENNADVYLVTKDNT
jgi:hypothetical protein